MANRVDTELVDDKRYERVPQWYWRADGGKWKQYTDEVQRTLEQPYNAFMFSDGPVEVELPPVSRLLDDRQQVYRIDFKRMVQINCSTDFERTIKRECQAVPRQLFEDVTWSYLGTNGTWALLEKDSWGPVEEHYRKYVEGTGSNELELQVPGRTETYRFDVRDLTQTNLESGTVRRLRRTCGADRLQESVVLYMPAGVSLEPMVERVARVNQKLADVVRRATGALESNALHKAECEVVEQLGEVWLSLDGHARELVSVVVAKVQAELEEATGHRAEEYRTNGPIVDQLQINDRLLLLLERKPPVTECRTTPDAMMLLAHAAMHHGGQLYGNFVVNFLVRGLDSSCRMHVLVGDAQQPILVDHLVRLAEQHNITMRPANTNNSAEVDVTTLVFDAPDAKHPIYVHLSSAPVMTDAQYVDVANLAVSSDEMDVLNATTTAAQCLEACRNKQFRLMGQLNAESKRVLERYLGSQWTLVTPMTLVEVEAAGLGHFQDWMEIIAAA